jgi:hypothetical protein
MAKKDYIPRTQKQLLLFLHNFKTKLPGYYSSLGLNDSEVAELMDRIDTYSTTLNERVAAETHLRQQVAALRQSGKHLLSDKGGLRNLIKRLKTSANYSRTIGLDLAIEKEGTAFDILNAKPAFKLTSLVNGGVRIDYRKKGSEGVSVYRKMAGESEFKFIGTDTESPYIDLPGEDNIIIGKIEYYLVYRYKDQEAGVRSNTQLITM